MNVERVFGKKLKGYSTIGKRDFARYVDILFKRGREAAYPIADTADKRTLAYLYEKNKVNEKEIYTILRKAQLG